jgi:tetratricopeptide (TPR) repeat protein
MRSGGLALLLVAAVRAAAHAQAPDPRGAKLFEEGRALAKAGKYREACAKFQSSLEIDPAIGTQLNYADCHEKLGQYAEAWRIFDGAADAEKITNPTRARFARERADALLRKVGVVVLEVQSPDPRVAILIGGRAIKAAPVIREIVDPGSVVITASGAGDDRFETTETVAAGQTITITIPVLAEQSQSAKVDPSDDAHPAERRRSRVYLAYGLGGVGVASLATGIVVGLVARGDYNTQFENGNCVDTQPNPMCSAAGVAAQNDARSLATTGTVLGVGGLVLIASGAVVFLTAPRDLVVTPTMTSQSAGVTLVGKF